MQESQNELALSYFDYLAKRFPVMCASDEFHFLPRAEGASRYYDEMDSLDRSTIGESIFTVKEFHGQFDALLSREKDLEGLIDLELLKANATGILIELEENALLTHNPLLYLKIACIGVDHSLTKPAGDEKERIERTLARLHSIPRLLQQGVENIVGVPRTYHEASLRMLSDCEGYLFEVGNDFPDGVPPSLATALEKVRTSLRSFGRFLDAITPIPDKDFMVTGFEATVRDRFLSIRSLPEVFEIGVEEYRENLEELRRLQLVVNPDQSWQEIYHAHCPEDILSLDTLTLYRLEMEKLRSFFHAHGFTEVDPGREPLICETPTYLQSVRSSASFAAAFSRDPAEKDFFYITTRREGQKSKESLQLLKKRLHREYKFLTAHETFPGHYLLDSTRRGLANPVRSQIESPLFYEGWAYYVESLLGEYGYIREPIEHLVDCKRRLWRAARCQIDIGLATGRMSLNEAVSLLTMAGFSREEALGQIDRFRLSPGYQLCYSLGRYEILKLRESYGRRMGWEHFHRQLLNGGQLPFHLIEKRFEESNPTQ